MSKPDKKKLQSENFTSDSMRNKRNKRKKSKSTAKIILWLIVFVIIGIGIFLATIKVLDPDYDYMTLVPDQAITLIEKYNKAETTQSQQTTVPTTTQPTTKPMANYLDFSEFQFDRSLQGNYIGNLMNGGMVASDSTYIYHAVDGKGIYRFYGGNETYSRLYKNADKLRYINNRGDFLYFVNIENNKLYKLQKGNASAVSIAENVKFAYCYDSRIYYITTDNRLCTMNVKNLTSKLLYNANDNELNFVGISLNRVFFTVREYDGSVSYLTIDKNGNENVLEYRNKTAQGEIESIELENGFFYYYILRDDGKYDLCRQKFGSPTEVELITKSKTTDYVTVASNRLYYTTLKKGTFKMKELNMNTNEKKTLLAVNNTNVGNTLKAYHGGEYDFIIGKKAEDGKKIYYSSGVYSASTNVMQFKNDKWTYMR